MKNLLKERVEKIKYSQEQKKVVTVFDFSTHSSNKDDGNKNKQHHHRIKLFEGAVSDPG